MISGERLNVSPLKDQEQQKDVCYFVNNTRKPIKGEIGLGADFKTLSTLQGAGSCALKGPQTVSVELNGLGMSFLRLTP